MALTNPVDASTTGFQSLNAATGVWNGRTLTAGAGISISNGSGTGGNPTITSLGPATFSTGTFVPSLAFGATSGTSAGVTFLTTPQGRYTQIGDTIFFCLRFDLTSKGAVTGRAAVTGLPFTVSALKPQCFIPMFSSNFSWDVGFTYILGVSVNSTNALYIVQNKINRLNTDDPLTNTAFADDTNIEIAGFYFQD